jgi:hypothetical protein
MGWVEDVFSDEPDPLVARDRMIEHITDDPAFEAHRKQVKRGFIEPRLEFPTVSSPDDVIDSRPSSSTSRRSLSTTLRPTWDEVHGWRRPFKMTDFSNVAPPFGQWWRLGAVVRLERGTFRHPCNRPARLAGHVHRAASVCHADR